MTTTLDTHLTEPTVAQDTSNCTVKPGIGTRLARQLVLTRLSTMQVGRLILDDRCDQFVFGDPSVDENRIGHIHVHNDRFYRRVVTGGDLGLAESYLEGDWDSPDLPSVFRFFCRNLVGAKCGMLSRATEVFARAGHWLARNTRGGSRRNIEAHYDLGDNFFELFLDPTMMYSSAIFGTDGASLEEAQLTRLNRVCERLDLRPDDHVMEIGTGWGGFAIHAAKTIGCRVTTTTISRNQYDRARSRVASEGLADRITVVDHDYRDLEGQFDKLVSLEMIEAVGNAFYDEYFRTCTRLLKPNGKMLLQAIVMPEQRYASYLRSVDFIQKYIFPGGCLPTVTAMHDSVQRTSSLRLLSIQDFAADYAQTLREWRKRYLARLDDVRSLGYPERFIRMWDYYFCYCEGAFDERAVGVVHAMWGR